MLIRMSETGDQVFPVTWYFFPRVHLRYTDVPELVVEVTFLKWTVVAQFGGRGYEYNFYTNRFIG